MNSIMYPPIFLIDFVASCSLVMSGMQGCFNHRASRGWSPRGPSKEGARDWLWGRLTGTLIVTRIRSFK